MSYIKHFNEHMQLILRIKTAYKIIFLTVVSILINNGAILAYARFLSVDQ